MVYFQPALKSMQYIPARRKQEGHGADVCQPLDGLSADRHLARSGLDVHFLGHLPWLFQRAGALFSGKMAEAGEIPAVGAYLCGVCRADRLDFLPRGHDRAGIFLYPVYVCAAQRSRFDGTLHEPENLMFPWRRWRGGVRSGSGFG